MGWEATENEQPVRNKVNLFRPDDVTSLLSNGEVLHNRLLAVNEHIKLRSRAISDQDDRIGHHRVIEDRMVGSWCEISRETSGKRETNRGVRAIIVAMKRLITVEQRVAGRETG